jgi:hypothetical protein
MTHSLNEMLSCGMDCFHQDLDEDQTNNIVSRWPLTAEARVRARVNPCGICGG